MPPARKTQAQDAKTSEEPQSAVYALVHLLPNYKPGDRLDPHLKPEVLELLLACDPPHASRDQPAE